jgi:hypothetical protein
MNYPEVSLSIQTPASVLAVLSPGGTLVYIPPAGGTLENAKINVGHRFAIRGH